MAACVTAQMISERIYASVPSASILIFVLSFVSAITVGLAAQPRFEALETTSGRSLAVFRAVVTGVPVVALATSTWAVGLAASNAWLISVLIRTVLLAAGIVLLVSVVTNPAYATVIACAYLSISYFLGGDRAWNLMLAPNDEGSLEICVIIFLGGWLFYCRRGGKSSVGVEAYQQ